MKPTLATATLEQLEAELAQRRLAAKEGPPQPIPIPDWKPVIDCVRTGVRRMVEDGREDEKLRAYIYEAAVTAVYGEAYWTWRRKQSY